jgi:hypothetical protein
MTARGAASVSGGLNRRIEKGDVDHDPAYDHREDCGKDQGESIDHQPVVVELSISDNPDKYRALCLDLAHPESVYVL